MSGSRGGETVAIKNLAFLDSNAKHLDVRVIYYAERCVDDRCVYEQCNRQKISLRQVSMKSYAGEASNLPSIIEDFQLLRENNVLKANVCIRECRALN